MERDYCIGKTVANGQLCELWRRTETHEHGRRNGMSDDIWLKQVYEDGEVEWVPWIDLSAKRPCYEVKITEGNRIKSKWGETLVYGTCSAEIWCNQRKVYEYHCRDIEYALAKAQTTIVQMGEHPFRFDDPNSEIGRRIWFYRQPAIIESLMLDQGCIMIQKDGGGVFDLSQPWDDKNDIYDPWDGESVVKDDVFSDNIYWFRD